MKFYIFETLSETDQRIQICQKKPMSKIPDSTNSSCSEENSEFHDCMMRIYKISPIKISLFACKTLIISTIVPEGPMFNKFYSSN